MLSSASKPIEHGRAGRTRSTTARMVAAGASLWAALAGGQERPTPARPAGDMLTAIKVRAEMHTKSQDELDGLARAAGATIVQMGAIDFYRGLKSLQHKPLDKRHLEQGLQAWETASSSWFDPFASVKLAAVYFKGIEAEGLVIKRDYEKCLRYLNRAWEVGAVLIEERGKNEVWDGLVYAMLGIGDSFHGLKVRGEFDWRAALEKVRADVVAHREGFKKAFGFTRQSPARLAFERHY